MNLITCPEITPEYLESQHLSPTFPERFWKRVFITPTHWLWEGARRAPVNHGTIWRGVRNVRTGKWQWIIYAHVASWILTRGPIPEGKQVNHCCPGKHVAWCVNPDHLYLGTEDENRKDRFNQYVDGFHKPRTDQFALKLSREMVKAIRSRYTGKHGEQAELAREFGVTRQTVGHVVRGKTW